MKRIIVTGSRDWRHEAQIRRKLLEHGPGVVVHGMCRGADAIAGRIARELGWPVEPHPAAWEALGANAGPVRNQRMADLGADVCLAFVRESSRGTVDMMARAGQAGIPLDAVHECPTCEGAGCWACRDRGFFEMERP